MKVKNFKWFWWMMLIIAFILPLFINNDFVRAICIRIIIYILFIHFLRFLLKSEHKDILKVNHSDIDNLYYWTNSLEEGHLFIKDLLEKHIVDKDILVNLQKIKNELLVKCDHDIGKLYLLEAYFKVAKENKEKEYYYTSIIGILVAGGIVIIRELILEYGGTNIVNIISNFGFFDFIFLVFIFFAFMANVIFLGNKRLKLIQEMLSQCIEEKKNKSI